MGCYTKPVQTASIVKEQAAQIDTSAPRQETTDVKKPQDTAPPREPRAMEKIAAERKTTVETENLKEKSSKRGALRDSYIVKAGDTLWWIAGYRDIYNDPFMWPIIYDANNKTIENPGKIYPGMALKIPRTGYRTTDIENARKQAGARKPYTPPARAVPPVD